MNRKIPTKAEKEFKELNINAYAKLKDWTNKDGLVVVNFFRGKGTRDDDGFPENNHIGFLEVENLDDIVLLFKKKFPEETL